MKEKARQRWISVAFGAAIFLGAADFVLSVFRAEHKPSVAEFFALVGGVIAALLGAN